MSGGSSSRHAACVECRQRKVRCDGGQPYCQNCSRRGADCVYAGRKQEMMEMIKDLTERLSHAEETLITSRRYPAALSPASSTGPSSSRSSNAFCTEHAKPVPPAPIAFDFSTTDANEWMSMDDTWALYPDSQCTWPDLQPGDLATDDSFSPVSLIQKSTSQSPQIADIMQHDEEKSADELAPPQVLNELYALYFDKPYDEYFMMTKDRFMMSVHDSQSGLETQSLRLIVLAHSASFSPPHMHLSRSFYELSRKYFEQAELGRGFLTITALQVCILLALFELNQALFTRAWTSVSRVNWMVQMFMLQKEDEEAQKPTQKQEPRRLLSATSDKMEMEERRRTFWSAFNLSCFASIGSGWKTCNSLSYADITTLLPIDDSLDSISRLTLYDAFRLSGSEKLSTSQAFILTNALSGRCLTHITYAAGESRPEFHDYDFWMHHCHLIESAIYVASTTSSQPYQYQNDTTALCFSISLQAILVCLHNAGAVRVLRTNLSQPPNASSDTNCQKAALEIAKIIRMKVGCIDLAKMSPWIPWSIYVAAQACIRALHANSNSPSKPPSRSSSTSSMAQFWAISPGTTTSGGRNSKNGSNNNPSPFDRSAKAEPPASRLTIVDALKCLMDALGSFKLFSPVSGVFEAELKDELRCGKVATDDRLIGFVNFPLDGQHLS